MFRLNAIYRLCLVLVFLLSIIFVCTKLPANITEIVEPQISHNISRTKLKHIFTISSTTVPTTRFYVFNKNCKIPYVDPFSPEVMRIYQPPDFKPCTHEPSLVTITYNGSKQQYILHVDEAAVMHLMPNVSNFACYYREIARGNDDSHSSMLGPVYFLQDTPVPRHILGIYVECHVLGKRTQVIQSDAFSFVQFPLHRNESSDSARANQKYPNIIFLGIDSMSRTNFRRTMQKTARFVRKPGWTEMLGYNKVGDNTLPNMLAFLTGLTDEKYPCDVEKPGCFDNLSYLWNHFKAAGYLTAFAEDLSEVDTFNYLKPGFIKQPFDYYLRPFLMTIEQSMKITTHFNFNYCVGRRLSFSYVFDFCEQIIARFINERSKPIFGVFWTNSFTHDNFMGGASLDELFVNYLERFEQLQLFNTSIVVLLSDHGMRTGPLLQMSDGFLEERLPMLHIYMPPWYSKQNPKMLRSLQYNRHMLSTPFDLYRTMCHVLTKIRPGLSIGPYITVYKARSLFKRLPRNRACEEVGILDHFCTCEPYTKVSMKSFMYNVVKLIVYRINKFLKTVENGEMCARLYLSKMFLVQRKINFNEKGMKMKNINGIETYRFEFVTRPNNADYIATVKCSKDCDTFESPFTHISRLDEYKNQSYCIRNKEAKKFCYCIDPKQNLISNDYE